MNYSELFLQSMVKGIGFCSGAIIAFAIVGMFIALVCMICSEKETHKE